jgi:hypothetical protein
MTLLEIRTAVWEELGEPPNCDPADEVSLARLNGWINRAYKKILFWKFPDGSQVRFPATEGEVFFKTSAPTGTIVGATLSTITLGAGAGSNDDQYNGWMIETTEGKSLIVAYDGAGKTATLAVALGAIPSGAYTLSKRFMKFCGPLDVGVADNVALSSVTEIKEVQKLMLLDGEVEIVPAQRTDSFSGWLRTPGRPSTYLRRGAQIIFDCPVDEELWFAMEYAKIPPDLTEDGDEPQMPETFHEAVMMWALWRGYHWMQETDMAYSTKQDIMDFMRTTRAPLEMAAEREDAGVEVNFG